MLEQRDFDTLVIARWRDWAPLPALVEQLTDLEMAGVFADVLAVALLIREMTGIRTIYCVGRCPSLGEGMKVAFFTLHFDDANQPQLLEDCL